MSWVTSIVIMSSYLSDDDIRHIEAAPYRETGMQWRRLNNCEDFGGNKCGETHVRFLTAANNQIDRTAFLDHIKTRHFIGGLVMYMDTEGWVEVYVQMDTGSDERHPPPVLLRVTEPT